MRPDEYNRFEDMSPAERAYEREVIAAEQQRDEEEHERLRLLPTLNEIDNGLQLITLPQIKRALNTAQVQMSPLQYKDFMQSLATQVQQGI